MHNIINTGTNEMSEYMKSVVSKHINGNSGNSYFDKENDVKKMAVIPISCVSVSEIWDWIF